MARLVVAVLVAVAALAANFSLSTAHAPAAQAAGGSGGMFVAATGRLLDTRTTTPLSAGVARLVQATGQAGIPTSGVAAVAVTVSAVTPASSGYLWASAEGAPAPQSSVLSYGPTSGVAGTVSNSAIVAVNATSGKIQLQSSSTVDIIVDVQGYYTTGSSPASGGFVPTFPTRLVDTRNGTGGIPVAKLQPGSTTTIQVTGKASVPAGASATFVNVTIVDTDAASKGFIRAYAAGGTVPVTSTNYQPNATTAMGMAVPLSSSGAISITLSSYTTSPVDMFVDVQGYYAASSQSSTFTATAARVYDGRSVPATIAANGTVSVQVAGTAGIPAVGAGVTAVALNVQVIAGASGGYALAYPSGQQAPTVSTVNFSAGETRGNLAMVAVGDDGKITVRNSSASPITLVLDAEGWYTGIRHNAAKTGPRYNATRLSYKLSDRLQATVDVGTGNLSVTSTDLTVPTIDGDVQLGMTFNSLLLGSTSLPQGAGGYGWQARFGQDNRLLLNSDGTIVYLAPGGTQGKYLPKAANIDNSIDYTSPSGFKNTLKKKTDGTWTLTDKKTNAVSTFDTTGRLTSVKDRNSQSTTLTYNGSGYLTSVTGTRSGVTSRKITLVPDSQGRVQSMSQGNDTSGSRSVTYTYTAGGQLATIKDAGNRTTTFGYGSAGGDLTSISNSGGNATTFTYDSNHRVSAVSRDSAPNASVTRLSYSSATQTLVADPNTDQAQPVASVPHTTYTLDDNELVTKTVDALNRSRSKQYTSFGDVSRVDTPGGGTAKGEYGANSGESLTKVTAPTGASMSMTYSGSGPTQYLPTGVTDSQGLDGVASYDGVGNPTSNKNNGSAATASVDYNSDGTLKKSTDPKNNATTYTENTGTHQIQTITPPTGSGMGATQLTYDGYGRLSKVTDGRGASTTYAYNTLDQVTGITYAGTGLPATTAIGYTYNNVGSLKTRTDASGTTTWTYNTQMQLLSRVNTAGGGTLTYGHDRNGNITKLTNPRGVTTYVYDDANQVTSRTGPDGATDRYAYNADGKRTDTWWRTNAGNTTFAAHTYTQFDMSGRVARTWTSRNSSDATRAFDTSYCYSVYVSGQVCPNVVNVAPGPSTDTPLVEYSLNNLTGDRSDYTYDASKRLTKVTNWYGKTYEYAYDANGNRTTHKVDGTTTQTLTVNAGNQVTSSGYAYDLAGNQTNDPTTGALRYNTAGQLISSGGAGSTQNTYAGDGHNELTHQSLPSSVTIDYTYGTDTQDGVPTLDSVKRNTDTTYIDNDPVTGYPQALALSTGENAYLATDGQGSVVALISSTSGNAVSATYTYDPYGVVTATTGTGLPATSNPYRHTGAITDPLTGWNRHGTRYNNTATGRWTTTDPITRLNDPDQANPYTYAASNPVNYTDPTGQHIWTDLVGGIIGVVTGGLCAIGTGLGGAFLCGGVGLFFGLGVTYTLNYLVYGEEVEW